MMNLQERMSAVLAKLPATGRGLKADLARACGVKPPSVQGWINGTTKEIDLRNALSAVEFFAVNGLPGINPMWLANGSGRMHVDRLDLERQGLSAEVTPLPVTTLPVSAVVHRLADLIKQVDPGQRRAIGETLRQLAVEPDKPEGCIAVLEALTGTHETPADKAQLLR